MCKLMSAIMLVLVLICAPGCGGDDDTPPTDGGDAVEIDG